MAQRTSGPNECDAITVWPAGPNAIVRVSPSGNDANDGSSWALAKKTIQAGINAAKALRGDVWVKVGTYEEPIFLQAYVYLYGGFAGTETLRSQRDWIANQTVLNGASVTARRTGYRASTIDGFLIQGNSGVSCAYSSPIIANNTISTRMYGIDCANSSSPIIAGNNISWNKTTGLGCNASSPTVTGNTIASNPNYGIYCQNSSAPTIVNNAVKGNGNCGIYATASPLTVTNNTITGNGDAGIRCSSSSSVISNNILAFNFGGVYKSGGTPTLRNNCVYGNTSYDYSGILAGAGDISADPLFASAEYPSVHIQPGSPCRNAGWNDAPGIPPIDIDDQPRIQPAGGTVDIGADESDGTVWPATPAMIVRVSPSGDDANDGLTWAFAKLTIQAGIEAVKTLGGDVWVKAGVYNERITLKTYAHVFGGFAGSETLRSQRDWTVDQTILDGGAGGPLLLPVV